MKKFFLAIIATMLSVLAFLPASASANDFYFDSATYDFYLSKTDAGSTLKVREELVAVFPETNQNHGITRVIPYTNQGGKNLTMASSKNLNISVTRNGQPENIAKIENEDDAFIVYIGNSSQYVHGQQDYILEYEFQNVITDFDSYQELYWDTNGIGWSQKFNTLTANLHFENIDTPSLANAWCYVGTKGSNDQTRCEINNISDGLSFTTSNLRSGENLTFDVQFPAGTFIVPHRTSHLLIIATVILTTVSLALVIYLAIAYSKYAKSNKSYYKGLSTPAQYIPDRNYTVAELSSVYLGTTKSPQVATLLELAVSHKVELVQRGKKDWAVRIKDTKDLTKDQLQTLQIIAGSRKDFQSGEEIPVEKRPSYSSTRNSLISSFPTTIKNSLVKKGLISEHSHSALPSFLLIFYIGGLIGGSAGLTALVDNTYSELVGESFIYPAMGIICVITTIISFYLISQITKYSKYTHVGLDASNYAAGLKEYISLTEKDRLKFNQSTSGAPKDSKGTARLYERLLPYAAIFGLEKSWLKQLQIYYDKDPSLAPTWYIGSSTFNTRDFSSALSSFNTSVSSMSSSSSSSGSGGGGFSGGGGGGGGGGGW